MRTLSDLPTQAAQRQAAIEDIDQAARLVKASTPSQGASKALAAFDAPVLEHLRQCNMAAYEKMLGDITADINQVLKQS